MTAETLPFEFAVASRALRGERQLGDAYFVQALADGVLVAVIDGLGHGEEAATASAAALNILQAHADEPLPRLIQRCHEAMQTTRGAAMVLARLNAMSSRLSWTGVGNVEAVLFVSPRHDGRRNVCLLNHSGVVGYRLPAIQARETAIAADDLLILATDGIDSQFMSETYHPSTPDDLARDILDRFGKATDDALVLVVRWLGRGVDTNRPGHAERRDWHR